MTSEEVKIKSSVEYETVERLIKQLTLVMKFVDKRPVIGVLSNVKFEDGTITGSNLSTWCQVKTNISGSFLLDGAKLIKMLKQWPKRASVALHHNGSQVNVIVSGKPEVTLDRLDDIMDYPIMPTKGEFVEAITLNKYALGKLDDALKISSKESLRPGIHGVHVTNYNMVSTDGHRLMMLEHLSDLKCEPFTITYSAAKALSFMDLAVLSVCTETGFLYAEDKISGIVIMGRINDKTDKFPNYRDVLPDPSSAIADFWIDADTLKASLNLAILNSNQTTKMVKFSMGTVGRDAFVMSSHDIDFGGRFERVIKCEHKVNIGASFHIGFNGQFMADMIDMVSDNGRVNIKFIAPNKAAYIGRSIIMPVMLGHLDN